MYVCVYKYIMFWIYVELSRGGMGWVDVKGKCWSSHILLPVIIVFVSYINSIINFFLYAYLAGSYIFVWRIRFIHIYVLRNPYIYINDRFLHINPFQSGAGPARPLSVSCSSLQVILFVWHSYWVSLRIFSYPYMYIFMYIYQWYCSYDMLTRYVYIPEYVNIYISISIYVHIYVYM
jgi:hypothetical protein